MQTIIEKKEASERIKKQIEQQKVLMQDTYRKIAISNELIKKLR